MGQMKLFDHWPESKQMTDVKLKLDVKLQNFKPFNCVQINDYQ